MSKEKVNEINLTPQDSNNTDMITKMEAKREMEEKHKIEANIDVMTEDKNTSGVKNILKVATGDISLLNEDTNFDDHINVKELPSEFKGYPVGTKISFKPITLEELETLNTDEVDPARAVAMLLKSIHCTTLPVEDLYYWDVMYIGIQRKLLAFGNTKGTMYNRCPKCGNIVSKSFEYTDLEFRQMLAPNLPMKMEVGGKKLEFGLLTMKDFLQIEVGQGELGVYARMIKNMPFDEAYNFVKHATGVDIKKLRFVDKQLNYGLKPFYVTCDNEVEVENPDFDETVEGSKRMILKPCGNRVVMEVQSPFEIVFPEDEISGFDDFEVQYG